MKAGYIAIIIMILLAPVFAYLAELVGYAEPLENVAEMLNVEEKPIYSGILPDYTVEGVNPYIGTLISGAVGALLTFLLAGGVIKLARKSRK